MRSLIVLLTALTAVPLLAQPLPPGKVTVDSTCSGYDTGVLTDGKWVEIGKEITQVYGARDALGNCGNSWVSAPAEGEHWVRLDWPQAVTLNQISLWWVQQAWWPRAVRVEMLSDTNWVSLTDPGDWLRPTAQHSVITFPPVTARTIRLLQHPKGGAPERGFLALQEITPLMQADAKPGLEGVRKLTTDELKALEPVKLERNIARLGEKQPGASHGVLWDERTQDSTFVPELVDGKFQPPTAKQRVGVLPGVIWPVPHVIDGVAAFFAKAAPNGRCGMRVLSADGDWLPPQGPVTVERDAQRHCLAISFGPTATGAVRLDLPPGSPLPVEIEAYRYLPAAPNVWPEPLVNGQYERDLLASGEEPSFGQLSTAALSMTPARALLGLKDDAKEVGMTWDGDILSPFPLRMSYGPKRERMADYRDALQRAPGDPWRPCFETSAQMSAQWARQQAFV